MKMNVTIICYKTLFIFCFLAQSGLVTSKCSINKKKSIMDLCSKFHKSDFKFGKVLGQGSFGTVYQVSSPEKYPEGDYVLKKIKISEKMSTALSKEIQVGLCFKEEETLLGIHECFISGNSSKGSLYLLSNRMKFGLDKLTLKNRVNFNGYLNFRSWKLKAMIKMAKGLKIMHDNNIIHRDLKLENIMIGTQNKKTEADTALVDFGLSTNLNSNGEAGGLIGTPYYMAPEVKGNQKYGKPADIYSLGIVFYLFLRNEDVRLIYSDVFSQISIFIFDHIEDYQGLIQNMIKKSPSKRPSIDQIIEDLERIQSNQPSEFSKKKPVQKMTDLEKCTTTNFLNHEYVAKNMKFRKFSSKTLSHANCSQVIQMGMRNGQFQQLAKMRAGQLAPKRNAEATYYKKGQMNYYARNKILI